MIQKELVQTLIDEQLAGTDLFLVELKISVGNKILVFIDSNDGVTIAECITLSKHIESHLDREAEDFELEVSSAGLEHAFKCIQQYHKNIGKTVAVVLKDSPLKLTGTLLSATEQEIGLDVVPAKKKKVEAESTIQKIEMSKIKETKIVISFK